MTALEFHPLANLFPLIDGAEFDQLVADIKANGLLETIVLYEGKILDGRNRYRACLKAGKAIATCEYENLAAVVYGASDPLAFVLSKNMHRRHLTTDQRASIAAELATMKVGDNQHKAVEPLSNDRPSISTAKAAELLNVSTASVSRAKERMRADPEAHEQAKAGTLPKKRSAPSRALADPEQWSNRFRDVVHSLARVAGAANRDEATQHIAMVASDEGLRGEVCKAAILLHEALGEPPPKRVEAADEPVVEAVEPPVADRTPPESFRTGGWPGEFTGNCRMVLGTGGLAGRAWRVHRASHNRSGGEPVAMTFATPMGSKGAIYELPPDQAREMAKALVAYANWLDPERRALVDPEPVEIRATATASPDELRAWAKTIDLDRLTKHVEATGLRGCRSKLEAFLGGKHGSYHLHQAIETVRADLSDYEGESR
jgi:ParB-like chromosome segregation protein Spo0J